MERCNKRYYNGWILKPTKYHYNSKREKVILLFLRFNVSIALIIFTFEDFLPVPFELCDKQKSLRSLNTQGLTGSMHTKVGLYDKQQGQYQSKFLIPTAGE